MIKKNTYSIVIALIILYLSLTPSDTFDRVSFLNIPFLDKIVHLGMYFVLMTAILFENIKSRTPLKQLFLMSVIPLFYGILIELLQSFLTQSRSGSFFDILFNATGIIISIVLWVWIKPYNMKSIR